MKAFTKLFIFGTIIGISVAMFQNDSSIWVAVMTIGILVALFPKAMRYRNELAWIGKALVDDEELKKAKKERGRYLFLVRSIRDGVIRKGMRLNEVRKTFTDNSFALGWDFGKEAFTVTFFGYGEDFPTPELELIIRDGTLIGLKTTATEQAELLEAWKHGGADGFKGK